MEPLTAAPAPLAPAAKTFQASIQTRSSCRLYNPHELAASPQLQDKGRRLTTTRVQQPPIISIAPATTQINPLDPTVDS